MNLKSLFKPAELPVTVIMERSCFIGGKRYEEGSTHTFPPKVAAEICANGSARNPSAQAAAVAKADDLETLLPPPVEPAPVPDAWAKLPECFSQWWRLNESRSALITRRDAIWDIVMGWYVNRSPNFSMGLTKLPREQSVAIFKGINFEINKEFPQDLERLRFLKDAYHRAEEAIGHWNESNLPNLIRFQLEASTHTQVVHGELCRDIKALHAKGLELFALRIEPLGLSPHKIAELFQGSADCEKFARIQTPTLQDLKLAWAEAGHSPVHYIAQPPTTLAQLVAGYDRTAAEVATLDKQADKELAQAKRVTSKAA